LVDDSDDAFLIAKRVEFEVHVYPPISRSLRRAADVDRDEPIGFTVDPPSS